MRNQSNFGSRLGENMKQLASLLMQYQARKQEQSNWDKMFGLKEGAQASKDTQAFEGSHSFDSTGGDYYTESAPQMNVRPGLQEMGPVAPGNMGNAFNPPQADPMDAIKLQKAQVELDTAKEKLKNMRGGKEEKTKIPKVWSDTYNKRLSQSRDVMKEYTEKTSKGEPVTYNEKMRLPFSVPEAIASADSALVQSPQEVSGWQFPMSLPNFQNSPAAQVGMQQSDVQPSKVNFKTWDQFMEWYNGPGKGHPMREEFLSRAKKAFEK